MHPAHLDLASWVLAATFLLFVLAIVVAMILPLLVARKPREVGVLESVFRLRREQLITAGMAQEILARYDEIDRVDGELAS